VSIRTKRLLPSLPHERLLARRNPFHPRLLHQLRVPAKDPSLLAQLRVLARDQTPTFLALSCSALRIVLLYSPNQLRSSHSHERLLARRNPSFRRPVLRAQQRVLAKDPILLAQQSDLARNQTPRFLAISLGLLLSIRPNRLLPSLPQERLLAQCNL